MPNVLHQKALWMTAATVEQWRQVLMPMQRLDLNHFHLRGYLLLMYCEPLVVSSFLLLVLSTDAVAVGEELLILVYSE